MYKRTPLFETHQKLKARLVEFGGWEMPVQYSGVLDEHRAVRTHAGLFDISHMGEILITGPDAQAFVNHISTNDIRKITDGQCQYSCLCYPDGGIVDDVIFYQYSPQKYFVVVNAANTEKDFQWMLENKKGNVTIENLSDSYCQLALQGPQGTQILNLALGPGLALKPFFFMEATYKGHKIIISRTGYTGEDGYEIYGPSILALPLWNALMEKGLPLGLKPIGLAARDSLRLESAYSLYGHEISKTINPLEAKLSWVVSLDKEEFVGQESLRRIKKEGPARKLIGLVMEEAGVPRDGFEVYEEEKKVGYITSGTFSPTLNQAIGIALVSKDFKEPHALIEMRGKKRKAKVTSLPFYKRA